MTMMDTLIPQTVSVRDVQRNYRKIFDLVRTSGEPVIVLKNNQPEVVIASIEKLEKLERQLRKLEEKEALEAIRAYQREKRKKRLKVLRKSLVNLWQEAHED